MSNKDTAIKLIKEERFSEALQVILVLIKENDADWNLQYLAGQCYKLLGNLDQAIDYLSKAEKENEDEPQILLALGIAYQLSEKYGIAIEKLKKATELDKSLFSAHNSLGLTYRKMGQLQDALNWYNKAYECLVENIYSRICNPRSLCFKDVVTADGKEASVILPHVFIKTEQELKSNPECAVLHNNIGVVLAESGKYDEAREQFEQSIEMTPDGFDYPLPIMLLRELDS